MLTFRLMQLWSNQMAAWCMLPYFSPCFRFYNHFLWRGFHTTYSSQWQIFQMFLWTEQHCFWFSKSITLLETSRSWWWNHTDNSWSLRSKTRISQSFIASTHQSTPFLSVVWFLDSLFVLMFTIQLIKRCFTFGSHTLTSLVFGLCLSTWLIGLRRANMRMESKCLTLCSLGSLLDLIKLLMILTIKKAPGAHSITILKVTNQTSREDSLKENGALARKYMFYKIKFRTSKTRTIN